MISVARRRLVAFAVSLATVIGGVIGGVIGTGAPAVEAAPPGDDAVVAFEVRGVGFGHGQGMSQWGAVGRALDGQDWEHILDAYYGGTQAGTRSDDVRIRLWGWNDTGSAGVISTGGGASWNGNGSYTSLYAVETGANVFSVYGLNGGLACPGTSTLPVPDVVLTHGMQGSDDVEDLQRLLQFFGFDPQGVDGWYGDLTSAALAEFQADEGLPVEGDTWNQDDWEAAEERLGEQGGVDWGTPVATGVSGPIEFETTANESSADPGAVLGLCTSSGSIRHYRGSLELHSTPWGNRVVNEVDVENYVRGVVPKESSPAWGDLGDIDPADGEPEGMHALRAQSVSARSFGLSESRYNTSTYPYADTCDTSSCQVYGGAATRSSATASGRTPVEHPNTDATIADTAGVVRVWPDQSVVSTMFSASNGPRTAGGQFTAVDDPWDDVRNPDEASCKFHHPCNPNHTWTRIIDADAVVARYDGQPWLLSNANGVHTRPAPDPNPFDGYVLEGKWANLVDLGNGSTVSAWDFHGHFGLPSPGFELIPIRRTLSEAASFAFIGDSVGTGIVGSSTRPFEMLTEGVFSSSMFDALGSRRTDGGLQPDGVAVAETVPLGTDLVVVELGYNDHPGSMPGLIDTMMATLRARDVGRVAWVTVSERLDAPYYTPINVALHDARARWDELVVIDWHGASSHGTAARWYSDGVHLTSTGNAEFSLWLREQVLGLLDDDYVPPPTPRRLLADTVLRVPVLGVGGVPEVGVSGVALNVTSVGSSARGNLRVWPCGLERPGTSSVNYALGVTTPNAVVVPVDETGEVCVWSLAETDVLVDVSAWFGDAAAVSSASDRIVDTRDVERLAAGSTLRVPVLGVGGVPEVGVSGVALNVTSVGSSARGNLRVWPCGLERPGTSSVNYALGVTTPNAVVVPVDETGEVCVWSLAETDVLVDVSAWFGDAAAVSSASDRIVDTRDVERLAAGSTLRVPVLGVGGVPESGVSGVALNVTSVGSSARGNLRVWPCGLERPGTSSVNYALGVTTPNAVVVPVDETGEVCVWSLAETDVLVDVSAWFGESAAVSSASDRIVDTRYGIGPIPPR